MPLNRTDAPVAHSMVDHLDHRTRRPTTPFPRYACCWMAFNSIYFVAYRDHLQQGNPRPRNKPVNELPSEAEHLQFIATRFTPRLTRRLLKLKAFQFFLNRRPRWHHGDVPDINGVQPNGVTNIGKSIYSAQPVLAQLDRAMVARIDTPAQLPADQDALAAQIVFMLFTVRNNMFHGGKELLDPNANTVLRNAYMLLRRIVDSFLIR